MRSPILALLAPLIASFALQTLAAPQPPVAKQPGNEAAGDKAAHLKPQAKVHSPPARAKPATYGQQHSPLSLGGRPLQKYPKSARPAGTFSNGAAALIGEPDQVNVDVSAIAPEYQAREIDLPFGRLQKGTVYGWSCLGEDNPFNVISQAGSNSSRIPTYLAKIRQCSGKGLTMQGKAPAAFPSMLSLSAQLRYTRTG